MYRSVKVSAISLKPTKWDKASNAEKLEAFFVEAAKDAPQLILATEGVLEGYVVMDVIELRSSSKPVSVSVSLNGAAGLSIIPPCLLTRTATSAAPITKRSLPKARTRRGTLIASARRSVRLIHLSDVPAF